MCICAFIDHSESNRAFILCTISYKFLQNFKLDILTSSFNVDCAGVLITGGSDYPTAVELYLPESGDVCLMPQISGIRDVSRDIDV